MLKVLSYEDTKIEINLMTSKSNEANFLINKKKH